MQHMEGNFQVTASHYLPGLFILVKMMNDAFGGLYQLSLIYGNFMRAVGGWECGADWALGAGDGCGSGNICPAAVD